MIAKFFRSYSVSYLRQKTNFRDHRLMWCGCGADVVWVRCSRDSRDWRGPRGSSVWTTAVPPDRASRETGRTRETPAFLPL